MITPHDRPQGLDGRVAEGCRRRSSRTSRRRKKTLPQPAPYVGSPRYPRPRRAGAAAGRATAPDAGRGRAPVAAGAAGRRPAAATPSAGRRRARRCRVDAGRHRVRPPAARSARPAPAPPRRRQPEAVEAPRRPRPKPRSEEGAAEAQKVADKKAAEAEGRRGQEGRRREGRRRQEGGRGPSRQEGGRGKGAAGQARSGAREAARRKSRRRTPRRERKKQRRAKKHDKSLADAAERLKAGAGRLPGGSRQEEDRAASSHLRASTLRICTGGVMRTPHAAPAARTRRGGLLARLRRRSASWRSSPPACWRSTSAC